MDVNEVVTTEKAATLKRLMRKRRFLLPGQSFLVIVAVVNDDMTISGEE